MRTTERWPISGYVTDGAEVVTYHVGDGTAIVAIIDDTEAYMVIVPHWDEARPCLGGRVEVETDDDGRIAAYSDPGYEDGIRWSVDEPHEMHGTTGPHQAGSLTTETSRAEVAQADAPWGCDGVSWVIMVPDSDCDGRALPDQPLEMQAEIRGWPGAWTIRSYDDAGMAPDDELGDDLYDTYAEALAAAHDAAKDIDEMACPECGEDRMEDGIDVAGNSCLVPRRCQCVRRERLAEEDRDPDGDWAVVDMDGREISRHSSQGGAAAKASHDAEEFSENLVQTHQANSGAYIPRSVIHVPCGSVRAGQYSTSWYSPGCTHYAD